MRESSCQASRAGALSRLKPAKLLDFADARRPGFSGQRLSIFADRISVMTARRRRCEASNWLHRDARKKNPRLSSNDRARTQVFPLKHEIRDTNTHIDTHYCKLNQGDERPNRTPHENECASHIGSRLLCGGLRVRQHPLGLPVLLLVVHLLGLAFEIPAAVGLSCIWPLRVATRNWSANFSPTEST